MGVPWISMVCIVGGFYLIINGSPLTKVLGAVIIIIIIGINTIIKLRDT